MLGGFYVEIIKGNTQTFFGTFLGTFSGTFSGAFLGTFLGTYFGAFLGTFLGTCPYTLLPPSGHASPTPTRESTVGAKENESIAHPRFCWLVGRKADRATKTNIKKIKAKKKLCKPTLKHKKK